VQGAGAALVLPAALASVLAMFPEGPDRNRALGVWGAMGALGATVGLLAGGLLTKYVGWQAIFLANLPVGLAAMALAPVWVPQSRAERAERRFDPAGALAVTVGLVVLVYAVSTAPTRGWTNGRTISLFVVVGALLGGFVLAETRGRHPLLRGRLVAGRPVVAANVVGFLLGASFYSFLFVGTLYMQDVLGWSALQTGLTWLIASLSSVALAGLSQQLVTRVGPAPVLAAGMTLMAVGIAWGTGIVVDGRLLTDLAGPLVLAGAGTAFAFIPISVAGLSGVAPRATGIASGLLNTSQQIGGSLGVAIASTVATTHTSSLLRDGLAVPEALTGGFRWAMWVCAGIALTAVPVAALTSRRTVRREAAEVVRAFDPSGSPKSP
jgi:MFS family permease